MDRLLEAFMQNPQETIEQLKETYCTEKMVEAANTIADMFNQLCQSQVVDKIATSLAQAQYRMYIKLCEAGFTGDQAIQLLVAQTGGIKKK